MGANEKQVGGRHYMGDKLQHWDLVASRRYDYFQGQITRYIDRWKHKGGLEDLKKAQHYLEKYIEVHSQFLTPIDVKAEKTDTLSAMYDAIKDIERQFLWEGGVGKDNLYTCRQCREQVTADNPVRAFQLHGECASSRYVAQ
jgi:Protein of unknwon function (DUF3310)